MTDQELVDALDEVWSSTTAVGAELTEAQWQAPTDCPGWNARDVLAHVIGIEELSMGRPAPDVEVPDYDHLVSDIGRTTEAWVEAMRSLSGAEVLERFVEVTGERMTELRGLDAVGFDADAWTPLGPGTVRDLLPFRIFDSWVHEQDVRLAVERPGGLDGAGAEETMRRCSEMMGYAVAKGAGAPDGTTVTFELSEPLARCFAVMVEGRRGWRLKEVPESSTVTVRTTGETFVRLACGRTNPERAEVSASGDPTLASKVLANLRFLRF